MNLGAVNRSAGDHKAPGGKGINVSRVLKRLGHQSEALGFVGGFTGSYVKDVLQKEEIQTNFVEVQGDTRINVKVKGLEETELNGTSPNISEQNLSQLQDQLANLSEGDVLVLAGSVPSTVPATIYETLCKEALERKVAVYVDSSGDPMMKVLNVGPTFIKPNHHELGEMFNVDIKEPKDAVVYIKRLLSYGIQYVLVSFAGDGAVLGTKERILFATTPKGEVKNSVGAGDSSVAGFLVSQLENMPLEDALKFAVASGSATAFSTEFASRQQVESLIKDITIEEIGKGE